MHNDVSMHINVTQTHDRHLAWLSIKAEKLASEFLPAFTDRTNHSAMAAAQPSCSSQAIRLSGEDIIAHLFCSSPAIPQSRLYLAIITHKSTRATRKKTPPRILQQKKSQMHILLTDIQVSRHKHLLSSGSAGGNPREIRRECPATSGQLESYGNSNEHA